MFRRVVDKLARTPPGKNFVDQYFQARQIIDRGHGPNTPEGDEPEAPPPNLELVEHVERLDVLFEAMQDAEARNQRVYDDTEAALGRVARKHFPNLGNWDPDLLRKLADVIAGAAWGYYEQLDKLDYEQGRRDQGEPPRTDRGISGYVHFN